MRKESDDNGGVLFRVLIVGFTLLLIATTIVVLLSRYQNQEDVNLRKAIEISEFGMLMAMQKLGECPSWRYGFSKTEYEQGWYSVKLFPDNSGDTLFLTVVSKGCIGSIVDEKAVRLKALITNGDTLWNRYEK